MQAGHQRSVAGRVEEDLGKLYSPEQISARLRRDFPDDPEMWVHHNTIYESLYVQARGSLRADLAKCLRTGRIRRRPRRPDGTESAAVGSRHGDDQRTPRRGHRPGDARSLRRPDRGQSHCSAIGTVVERTTNYTLLLTCPTGMHPGRHPRAPRALRELPAQLRSSVTWDQGKEMSPTSSLTGGGSVRTSRSTSAILTPPGSGVNENTNGLLRQYFPKGTDLSSTAPKTSPGRARTQRPPPQTPRLRSPIRGHQ